MAKIIRQYKSSKKKEVPEGVPYYGPKSMCKCGHPGDGIISQHHNSYGGLGPGHGACKMVGCDCQQFTWAEYTEDFKRFRGLK